MSIKIASYHVSSNTFSAYSTVCIVRYTPGTGHYTQMVWSSVTRVGCGLVTFYNQDTAPLIARYYVCDYGPGGNKVRLSPIGQCRQILGSDWSANSNIPQVGDVMYRPGPACSACPGGTACSGRHPGLCSGSGSGVSFIDDNSLDSGRSFSSR